MKIKLTLKDDHSQREKFELHKRLASPEHYRQFADGSDVQDQAVLMKRHLKRARQSLHKVINKPEYIVSDMQETVQQHLRN